MGHVLSYVPIDAISRFHRMNGQSVHYSLGWDSNGRPTYKKICDHFSRAAVSREEASSFCQAYVDEAGEKNWQLFSQLGLGLDRKLRYHTFDKASQSDSQRAFLKMLEDGYLALYSPDSKLVINSKDSLLISRLHRLRTNLKLFDENEKEAPAWIIDYNSLVDKTREMIRQIEWVGRETDSVIQLFDNYVNEIYPDNLWPISRSRAFGIPIPVWYPIDSKGQVLWGSPIKPNVQDLPIDPQFSKPKGFQENQRGQPNGFLGDPNTLDTWVTSTITTISQRQDTGSSWEEKLSGFQSADIRAHGLDVLEAWTFRSIIRYLILFPEAKVPPFKTVVLHGLVENSAGEKMSKSLGNSVTIRQLIDLYPADAIRAWTFWHKPGSNSRFDERKIEADSKSFILKIKSIAKLPFWSWKENEDEKFDLSQHRVKNELKPIDQLFLKHIRRELSKTTALLSENNYYDAFNVLRASFESFSTYYINSTKVYQYQLGAFDPRGVSNLKALKTIYAELLIHAAPFLPFSTENAWSLGVFGGSVHEQNWINYNTDEINITEIEESTLNLLKKLRNERVNQVGGNVAASSANELIISVSPDVIKNLTDFIESYDIAFLMNITKRISIIPLQPVEEDLALSPTADTDFKIDFLGVEKRKAQ